MTRRLIGLAILILAALGAKAIYEKLVARPHPGNAGFGATWPPHGNKPFAAHEHDLPV